MWTRIQWGAGVVHGPVTGSSQSGNLESSFRTHPPFWHCMVFVARPQDWPTTGSDSGGAPVCLSPSQKHNTPSAAKPILALDIPPCNNRTTTTPPPDATVSHNHRPGHYFSHHSFTLVRPTARQRAPCESSQAFCLGTAQPDRCWNHRNIRHCSLRIRILNIKLCHLADAPNRA